MEDQQIPASSPLDNFFSVAFDENTRRQIRTAAQWARIVALCSFISYAVSLVVVFFGRSETIEYGGNTITTSKGSSAIGVLISTVIGVIINYFLYRFADSTIKGMDAQDSIKANDGFNNLRIYFKVTGILIIIFISLCFLGGLFMAIGAGLSR
jgi:hypothetical protein